MRIIYSKYLLKQKYKTVKSNKNIEIIKKINNKLDIINNKLKLINMKARKNE